MSKSAGIARGEFDLVIARMPSNLHLQDNAGWTKITGPSGARVYVRKAEVVRQVDLSEFGKDYTVGTVPLKRPNGKVQAHLDLSLPDAIKNFELLLLALSSLPPKEAKEPTKRAKEETTPEQKAEERQRTIDDIAARVEAKARAKEERARKSKTVEEESTKESFGGVVQF